MKLFGPKVVLSARCTFTSVVSTHTSIGRDSSARTAFSMSLRSVSAGFVVTGGPLLSSSSPQRSVTVGGTFGASLLAECLGFFGFSTSPSTLIASPDVFRPSPAVFLLLRALFVSPVFCWSVVFGCDRGGDLKSSSTADASAARPPGFLRTETVYVCQ